MEFITAIYYLFIISTLFFSTFFLIIYFEKWDKKKQDPVAKNPKPLTVLIPAYNEEESISETLQCLINSSYPQDKLNILIINDGSKDRTLEIIKKWHKKYPKTIQYINQKNQGKAVALNNGLKKVKTEFVAVIDADSFPKKDAMMRMMGVFETEPDTAAVTSNIQIKQKDTFLRKIQDIEYTVIIWIRKLLQHLEAIYVTPGPLAMYKTRVLKKLGGFDRKNLTEDIEIAWRLLSKNYKIRIAIDAIVLTNTPTKIKEWWNQRVRWSAGGIQTLLKYKNTFLKKRYGMVGVFVIPFFSFTMFTSVLGFTVVMYRIFSEIIFRLYYSIISHFVDAGQITNFFTIPNSFTFFGIVLLFLSIFYLLTALLSMGNKRSFNIKNGGILALIVFTIFYVSLFPLVLLNSIYRVMFGIWKW